MNIFKLIILSSFIITCSVTPNQEIFLKDLMGNYTITKAGKEFINMRMDNIIPSPVSTNNPIYINKEGEIYLKISDTLSNSLAIFINMEDEKHALYQLKSDNQYILIAKKNSYLLATTNTVAKKEYIRKELLLPIANKES